MNYPFQITKLKDTFREEHFTSDFPSLGNLVLSEFKKVKDPQDVAASDIDYFLDLVSEFLEDIDHDANKVNRVVL